MDNNQIVIATITWARDEQEEELLKKSLQLLAKTGIPVFLTDGGSSAAFLEFLGSFSNFTLSHSVQKGVWMQAKTSLFQAYQSGSKFIFYTEPDKLDFFENSLQLFLDKVLKGEEGIVLASRSKESFSTFPGFQQMTETTINNCCAEIIGKSIDYCYGPFFMDRSFVPYLNHLPQEFGWGWRPYTFGIARRLGIHIESFVGDFSCPVNQQQDNLKERIYRMKQLSQNIEGLTLSASISLQEE